VDQVATLFQFTGALERLLVTRDTAAFEAVWNAEGLERVGWEALTVARHPHSEPLERGLAALDRRLLAALERARALSDLHTSTFRVPELERWQHAAAAALVASRWGVAGLRTVIADTRAPLGRRYFAFLALAERHPPSAGPLFQRYLRTPASHHAFIAAAVEAARWYPEHVEDLLLLFDRIRGEELRRRFLGPKILGSLFCLNDARSVPLFRELCVSGHTDADADLCEVTRALVALRRHCGETVPNVKYPDPGAPEVQAALDLAEAMYEEERGRLSPVTVI
jgi:hypothetical protein